MATLVTALAAVVLAVGATVGLVQAQSSDGSAKPITQPLVTYGATR